MTDLCPICGGPAALLQTREDFEEVPDLVRPSLMMRVPVKVEEYRCQDPACEHEFERIIREPT